MESRPRNAPRNAPRPSLVLVGWNRVHVHLWSWLDGIASTKRSTKRSTSIFGLGWMESRPRIVHKTSTKRPRNAVTKRFETRNASTKRLHETPFVFVFVGLGSFFSGNASTKRPQNAPQNAVILGIGRPQISVCLGLGWIHLTNETSLVLVQWKHPRNGNLHKTPVLVLVNGNLHMKYRSRSSYKTPPLNQRLRTETLNVYASTNVFRWNVLVLVDELLDVQF